MYHIKGPRSHMPRGTRKQSLLTQVTRNSQEEKVSHSYYHDRHRRHLAQQARFSNHIAIVHDQTTLDQSGKDKKQLASLLMI